MLRPVVLCRVISSAAACVCCDVLCYVGLNCVVMDCVVLCYVVLFGVIWWCVVSRRDGSG